MIENLRDTTRSNESRTGSRRTSPCSSAWWRASALQSLTELGMGELTQNAPRRRPTRRLLSRRARGGETRLEAHQHVRAHDAEVFSGTSSPSVRARRAVRARAQAHRRRGGSARLRRDRLRARQGRRRGASSLSRSLQKTRCRASSSSLRSREFSAIQLNSSRAAHVEHRPRNQLDRNEHAHRQLLLQLRGGSNVELDRRGKELEDSAQLLGRNREIALASRSLEAALGGARARLAGSTNRSSSRTCPTRFARRSTA